MKPKTTKLVEGMSEVEVVNETALRARLYSQAIYQMGISESEVVKILGSPELAKVIKKALEFDNGVDAVKFIQHEYAENPDIFVEPCNIFDKIARWRKNRQNMKELMKCAISIGQKLNR